jgi:hypothetical protein
MRCTNGHDMQFGAKFCHVCGMGGAVPPVTPMPTSAPPYAAYVPTIAAPAGFDGFAIAALVLGILGGSILALIFSVVALSRIKKRKTRGKGLAIAGLVLGILGIIFWVLFIIGVAVSVNHTSKVSYNDGWNAAKEYYESNYSIGNCTNAYYDVSWIPGSDFEDQVLKGCRAFNRSYGNPDYRYPSNY